MIGILAFLLSGCVAGDEITSNVIEPDGAIAFSIYRLDLTSDETGEDAKKDLANYIQELEEKQGNLFTNLARANAKRSNKGAGFISGHFLLTCCPILLWCSSC